MQETQAKALFQNNLDSFMSKNEASFEMMYFGVGEGERERGRAVSVSFTSSCSKFSYSLQFFKVSQGNMPNDLFLGHQSLVHGRYLTCLLNKSQCLKQILINISYTNF